MTKKELLKATIFILLFLFILRSVTYIIRTNGQPKDAYTGFYAEKRDTIDVLMVGASAVFPYYCAPQIYGEYGITCYPLSSGNQSTKSAKYVIEEAYKTQDPKLIVIELRMFLYEDKGVYGNYSFVRGVTDNMKYSLHRIKAINALYPEPQAGFEVEDKLSFYLDIMKYHSNWKTMVLPEQLKCVFYEKKHPLKGYVFNTGLVPNDNPVPINKDIEASGMPADQEAVLYDLMAFLKENNQEALFIVSPWYDTDADQAVFKYMGRLITENGFDFLDMNLHYDEIGIDFMTDYYDGDGHVNALGSEKVSRFLGAYIAKSYDLPDNRGSSKFSSWDEAYTLWQSMQGDAAAVINEKIATGNYDEKSGGAKW